MLRARTGTCEAPSAVASITLGVVRWRSNPKPEDSNFNGGVASRSSCSALRIAEDFQYVLHLTDIGHATMRKRRA